MKTSKTAKISDIDKSSLDMPSEAGHVNKGKLPVEMMDIIWDEYIRSSDKGFSSEEEAKVHRLKLIEMRTAFVDECDTSWQQHTYNFCS